MIGGSTEDSWFLLLVGAIGTSEAHGIPLKRLRGHWEFWGKNMIGTLLRLEKTLPGAGYVLRPLFFTGPETELGYNAWFQTFAASTDRTRNGVLAEREVLKKIKERKERWRNLFQDDFKSSHEDPFKCWMKIGAEAKRQEKKAESWDGKTVTIAYPFLESLGENQRNAASTKDTEVDENPSGNSSEEPDVHIQGDSRSLVGMGESSTAIFGPPSSISKSTPTEDIRRRVKPPIVGVGETKRFNPRHRTTVKTPSQLCRLVSHRRSRTGPLKKTFTAVTICFPLRKNRKLMTKLGVKARRPVQTRYKTSTSFAPNAFSV